MGLWNDLKKSVSDPFGSHTKSGKEIPPAEKIQVKLKPAKFLENCGDNIYFNSDRLIATRFGEEYSNQFVFISEALKLKAYEVIAVEILETDNRYLGGLSVGIISENPSRIKDTSLYSFISERTKDPSLLQFRENVVKHSKNGQFLVFRITESPLQLNMWNNKDRQEIVLFEVQENPYYLFFDLHGSTRRIRAFRENVCDKGFSEVNDCNDAGSSVQTDKQNRDDNFSNSDFPILIIDKYIHGKYAPFKIRNMIRAKKNSEFQQSICQPPDDTSDCNTQSSQPESNTASNGQMELREETATLEGCKICLDKIASMLVLPCGHVCLCSSCAVNLLSSVEGKSCAQCPLCRCDIQNVKHMYKGQDDLVAETENQAFENCSICLDKIGNKLLLPCRHLCVCNSCADLLETKIRSPSGSHCPFCYSLIHSVMKVYTT